MHLSHLDSFFWFGGLLGHCSLLLVLLFRRRIRSFPFFTTLIVADILKTTVLYLVYRGGSQTGYSYAYFYTFWGFGLVDVILQLTVAFEIASHVFRPLGVWAPDLRSHLSGLIVISFSVAMVLTWLASPQSQKWKEALVIRGSLFSAALLSELFVGMTALSVTSGLPWKTHLARIAQGLGVYSIFCIALEAGNSYFGLVTGSSVSAILTESRMVLYLVCLVYWVVTLYRNEPQMQSLPGEIESYLELLRGQTAATLDALKGRERP